MPRIQRFYKQTVTTTVAQIVPYNEKRTGLLIKHYSGNPVFISNDQANITAEGFPMSAGDFLSIIRRDGDVPDLQLYAVTSLGSADLRIVETFGEV